MRRAVTFKDHFSGHAAAYASARPRYPRALFDWLAGRAPARDLAWDCATGNGQSAAALAEFFDGVVATDASATQIDAALPMPNVEYRVASAEASGLNDGSVDLITVSQALHWFDVEAFFTEASRVLRPGGLLAYWCYGFCNIDAGCDPLVRDMYRRVDAWWPPERSLVESGYRDIDAPWPRLPSPATNMTVRWAADQFLAYAGTWSACQRSIAATGEDPFESLATALREAWGEGEKTVSWPLSLTVCRRPARVA